MMLKKLFRKKDLNNDNLDLKEGVAHIENKNFQPAIESFKRCIDVDPEESMAFVGLCMAYSGLMDMDTAREYYEKLKELDPYLAAQLANTPTGLLLENEEII